jgi:hypothetical protein
MEAQDGAPQTETDSARVAGENPESPGGVHR